MRGVDVMSRIGLVALVCGKIIDIQIIYYLGMSENMSGWNL